MACIITGTALAKNKIEKWIEKANECFDSDNYECVLDYGQKIINRDPQEPLGYYFRAMYYWENEQYDSAIADIYAVQRLDPEDIDYLVCLGNLLYEKDQYEDACYYLLKALAIDVDNIDALILLSQSHFMQGNDTEDSLYQHNLAALDPDNAYLHYRKGLQYYDAGQYAQAVSHFGQSVVSDSTCDHCYYYGALALEEINANVAAMWAIDKAIALDGEDEDYYLLKGYLLMKKENFTQAIEVLEKGLSLNTEYPNTWYNLAVSNMRLENYNEALKNIDQCFKYGDEPEEYYYLQGDIKYYMYGDTAGCADWQKALELGKLEAIEDLINYCPDYEVRTSM